MMTEQAPPTEEQAPAPDAPTTDEAGTSTETETPSFMGEGFDPSTLDESLQGRYQEMQRGFTEKTQTLAEQRKQHEADLQLVESLRSDPDTQLAVLRALGEQHGYEFPDDTQDEQLEQFEDPQQQMYTEWEQFKATQAQAAEQQALGEIEQSIRSEVAKVEGLGDIEREFIFDSVLTSGPGPDGQPQIAKAVERLRAAEQAWQQRMIASKDAPAAPQSGGAGSQQHDLSNPEQRANYMASIIEAAKA